MAIFRGAGGSGDATTDATNEATVASNAAAAALTSQSNAANSAASAATSATNASNSATAAASSASTAASASSTATTQATNASTSATNAAASAATATTQASNAATSATNAANSATSAATLYDNFDDRYLGAKASAPSVDNDGNTLLVGALYWNSTDNTLYAWNGTTWAAVSGLTVSGVSSFNTRNGPVTLSSSDVTTALTYTPLNPANNLSEVTASTARTNLSVPSTTGSGATGTWNIDILGSSGTVTNGVYTTGNQTIGGTKTFSSTISGSIDGNAATVTNGIYTNGSYADPVWITSLAGSKISGNISGNAGTVTNGFYTTSSFNLGTTSIAVNRASGAQTLTGVSIDGNAGTVTDGVYTTGSYSNPSWITSLAGSKISGSVASATNADTATNGVVTTGSYSNPSWITSLSETKVLPSQTGNSGKVLSTDGTSTSWIAVSGTGTVTSVSGSGGSTGLTLTGGPITTSGTLTLGGTLDIGYGGTNATTASGARTNLLPSFAGNNGKVLAVNSGSTDVEFITVGGTGTVTSVAATVPTGLSVSGSPITTAGTLAITYASGYSIPTTSSQTNWDTAYTDRLKWDGGATGLTASTGRTSLGATTIGSNLFTFPDPSSITFPRFNADNTLSALTASDFRTAIGAGTSSTTGTVTSVTWTGGIVSVANQSTTPAFTIAGTSGGIPYFSSETTWASSTALAANALVIGGGAGAAPATTTTGTGVVTAIGNAVNTTSGLVTQTATLTASNLLLGGGSGTGISSTTTGTGVVTALGIAANGSGGFVTDTGTVALTNKTLTGTRETVFTITDAAAFEINPANGGIQTITLGASRTPKGTNFLPGQSVTLMVNDGTAFTLTWTDTTFGTGGVVWVGGTAPTLATTGFTVIELWEVGTQVYGALVGTVA